MPMTPPSPNIRHPNMPYKQTVRGSYDKIPASLAWVKSQCQSSSVASSVKHTCPGNSAAPRGRYGSGLKNVPSWQAEADDPDQSLQRG